MQAFRKCLLLLLLLSLVASLGFAGPDRAVADIVYNSGGSAGAGSIYAIDDDGSDPRLLAAGRYTEPFVAANGTVLFTDALDYLYPRGTVHAYKDGSTRVLATDVSGGASGAEAGFGGVYAFYSKADGGGGIRTGTLSSATTTPITLCDKTFPIADDPEGFLGWETVFGMHRPEQPTVNPVADGFVFTACRWQRYKEGNIVAWEDIPMLESYTAANDERLLVAGKDLWHFTDPSYSPDGTRLVLLHWRGWDAFAPGDWSPEASKGIKREAAEGIWMWQNGAGRQVLTLAIAEEAQSQNVTAPRIAGDGKIVFGFEDTIRPERDGIYSLPESCNACTMASATRLASDGSQPAWTPLHIAAPRIAGDGKPPAVSSLTVRPRRFRAARSGGSVTKGSRGAKVSYRLSKGAVVKFSVERLVPGRRKGTRRKGTRRKGTRCLADTRARRRLPRCTRTLPVRGSFTHRGTAGVNAFRFSGRIRRRTLKPGKYRLVAGVAGGAAKARTAFAVRR